MGECNRGHGSSPLEIGSIPIPSPSINKSYRLIIMKEKIEKVIKEIKDIYYVDIYGKQYFGVTDDKKNPTCVDVARWQPFEQTLRELLK